ncbi:MAG: hypothetical protein WCW03_00375 [Candidatus Paceibacterota bacterium]|jgi:hypothetical protein
MEERVAPKLVPFGNPVTILIAIIVGSFIIIGLILSFVIGLVGILITAIGAFAFGFGLTKHSPSKPREAGLLTLWDAPIKIYGQCVVVGGTTILADYFPFKLGSIKIAMDNKDRDFPMTIISWNKVPISGKVSVTACPDIADLEDFVQAGNDIEQVFTQLADPVFQEVQEIVMDPEQKMDVLAISREGNKIANLLHAKIKNNLFQRQAFGIELIKVRVNFTLDKDIHDDMRQVEREKFQREAERMEYQTMRIAAQELQVALARQYLPTNLSEDQFLAQMRALVQAKTIPGLTECLETIRVQRLVRDNMVARIESGGSGQNINLVNPDIKFGGKGGEKKGGK